MIENPTDTTLGVKKLTINLVVDKVNDGAVSADGVLLTAEDKAQQVDFDVGMAIEKLDSWLDG